MKNSLLSVLLATFASAVFAQPVSLACETDDDRMIQAELDSSDLKCDHDNGYQCPANHRCKIEWKPEPYDCVPVR